MRNRNEYIPTLKGADDCMDWLERNQPRKQALYGEIWFARLGSHRYTSVREGKRPVLIVSNDLNNRKSNTVTVIPFTGKVKRLDLPTHVVVSLRDGKSTALVEQVTTIDRHQLLDKVGEITDKDVMKKMKQAVLVHFGLEDRDETE